MRASLFATFVVMMVMLGLVRPASATPISYSEVPSGDLPTLLPGPVFTLDVGVNTVSGTSHTNSDGGDQDSFAFTVPVGMEVTNISYAFTRGGTAVSSSTIFVLDDGNLLPPPFLSVQTVDLFGASPVGMFGVSSLGPGTYGILNGGLNGIGWTDTYTWSLTVASTDAPVPEPASLALLGSGLLGATVRRWRARRTAV